MTRLDAARRTEILDAAIAVVNEVGYEAATVGAIAARARASKATLYRHWTGKPHLLATAFAERSGLRVEGIDTGSVAGDLRALMDVVAQTAALTPLILALGSAGQHDETLRQAVLEVLAPQVAALTAIVRRGVARGEVDPGRAPYASTLVVGAIMEPVFLRASLTAVSRETLHEVLEQAILPLLTPGRSPA